MSVHLRDVLMARLGELRHEPLQKRVRAVKDGRTVIDTTNAVLIWEPARVVPTYGVPELDVDAEILPGGTSVEPTEVPILIGRPVLDPSVPFHVRTTEGEPVRIGGFADGFRVPDPELDGYVIVEFEAFDAWHEEEDEVLGHPRDPFHGIDILRSARHVRVERDGVLLADSRAPRMLCEPPLPNRFYLPREDVTDAVSPSATTSVCAYKGHASYLAHDGTDVAWFYPEPMRAAAELAGLVAFFDEHVDVTVDGVAVPRPVTPWS